MAHHGRIEVQGTCGECPEHCKGCEELNEVTNYESCADGMGGHDWTEKEYRCWEMNDTECPTEERNCPLFLEGREPLSAIEFAVNEYIENNSINGKSVSVDEIKADFNLKSTDVFSILSAREEKGYGYRG